MFNISLVIAPQVSCVYYNQNVQSVYIGLYNLVNHMCLTNRFAESQKVSFNYHMKSLSYSHRKSIISPIYIGIKHILILLTKSEKSEYNGC